MAVTWEDEEAQRWEMEELADPDGSDEGSIPVVDTVGEEVAEQVVKLLMLVDRVCSPEMSFGRKRHILEALSHALRPEILHEDARRMFVKEAMERGVVDSVVCLVEVGGEELRCAATNFLGDFAFNSGLGARAVLRVFDRVVACFQHLFAELMLLHLPLLESAVLLCVNIAATCPSGHPRLIPLVRPVCLQIISNPAVSDSLRGSTILLLANLSMTSRPELRALRVADALLDLLLAGQTSEPGKSVAESVIIFLHGSESSCSEIDQLMSLDVISKYCVPLLERTLVGGVFRGMYPHLLYSARLFQVLAQSRVYARALVAEPLVVPLLLQVNQAEVRQHLRVESDLEGRRLALDALRSLTRFGLWPPGAGGCNRETSPDVSNAPLLDEGTAVAAMATEAFLRDDLPELLKDEDLGIRSSAACLWATLHSQEALTYLMVGQRLEFEGKLPSLLWRSRIVGDFLIPFLCEEEVHSQPKEEALFG